MCRLPLLANQAINIFKLTTTFVRCRIDCHFIVGVIQPHTLQQHAIKLLLLSVLTTNSRHFQGKPGQSGHYFTFLTQLLQFWCYVHHSCLRMFRILWAIQQCNRHAAISSSDFLEDKYFVFLDCPLCPVSWGKVVST